MTISIIVAKAANHVIGKDNQIPWYLPADLKYFKKTTLNHHVIMGRKTFESIGKPLPKRTNIVVTRSIFFLASGCIVAHSLEEALQIARDHDEEEVFIIGGAQLYEEALPIADRIYITEVDFCPEGDVFFPKIDTDAWREKSREPHPADEKNPYPYTFKILERIKTNTRPDDV